MASLFFRNIICGMWLLSLEAMKVSLFSVPNVISYAILTPRVSVSFFTDSISFEYLLIRKESVLYLFSFYQALDLTGISKLQWLFEPMYKYTAKEYWHCSRLD